MGVTRTDIYTDKQNKIAQYFKVLGHPARIAILQHLMNLDTCVCGDLVDEIGLAQSTISQHLKELKNAGLIQGTISGTSVCYCVNQENWSQMKILLETFLNIENNATNCC